MAGRSPPASGAVHEMHPPHHRSRWGHTGGTRLTAAPTAHTLWRVSSMIRASVGLARAAQIRQSSSTRPPPGPDPSATADQSTSSAGSRSRWASNSSSVIARACSRVQIAAVSGSTATAWWTLSRSPVSAACTAGVCTPMLVRLSAASWSGNAPTAVGWTPLWSTRHGTSTQDSGGRCHEHSTLRRWHEARHHTEIVSRVGNPDRDTLCVLAQLQSHLDAIHRGPMEAEPKGPLPPGSVGRDVSAGDSRAPNRCTAAVDP